MSTAATHTGPRALPHHGRHDRGADFLNSPWLWGAALTFGFYQALSRLPAAQSLVARYVAGNWTQYGMTGAFLIGACHLIRKGLELLQAHRALQVPVAEAARLQEPVPALQRAERLWQFADSQPAGWRASPLGGRVLDLCEYILRRGRCDGTEGYLRFLSSRATAESAGSYTLVWTAAGAIPVLGLLGAVLGLAASLSGIDLTAAQIENLYPAILPALTCGFDSIAVGLAQATVLVVTGVLIARQERRLLSKIDDISLTQLTPCFEENLAATPLLAAESQAADKLLEKTEALVHWQAGLWQQALEGLRTRWIEAAETQQAQFTRSLEQGMTSTLSNHQQQLTEVRSELTGGFRSVAQELTRVVESIQKTGAQQQQQFAAQISEIWEQMRRELSQIRSEQSAQNADGVDQLTRAVRGWHNDLAQTTEAMTAQLTELRQQGVVLRDIAVQETELARLQSLLQNNLQAVRAIGAFEESIHSLNAAVHLLTSRTRSHAA